MDSILSHSERADCWLKFWIFKSKLDSTYPCLQLLEIDRRTQTDLDVAFYLLVYLLGVQIVSNRLLLTRIWEQADHEASPRESNRLPHWSKAAYGTHQVEINLL